MRRNRRGGGGYRPGIMSDVLILDAFGLEFALAPLLQAEGCDVQAAAIDEAGARALAAAGIQPLGADLRRPETVEGLSDGCGLVVIGRVPDPMRIAGFVLECLPYEADRLVLLSNPLVYGRTDGAEVDESEPVAPRGARGRMLAAAEKRCLGAFRSQNVPTVVLRIGEMIGGPAPGGAADRRVNPVSPAKVAAAVMAAFARGRNGTVCHVAEGGSCPRSDPRAMWNPVAPGPMSAGEMTPWEDADDATVSVGLATGKAAAELGI